jgi:predicted dehydrogenase
MGALRAAVIGAGNMGRHHVRILGAMDDVELVGVVDPDTARAESHASLAGAPVFASLDELPQVDIAVVATPTEFHAENTMRLLKAGTHVLVEKPLAPTAEEAEALVELARERGLVLAVGHVERFNAAVSLVASLVRSPKLISIERLSPFTPRIRDSVVFDLMVHDLDIACWLAGGYPVRVEAAGGKVFSEDLDVASAVLTFGNGCVATLQASRATQDKVRSITVTEPDRYILADTVRQDVSVKREAEVAFDDAAGQYAYRQANVVEVPYLDRTGEPLARELRDFIEAARGEHAPRVSGEDGVNAVRLAAAVEAAARG